MKIMYRMRTRYRFLCMLAAAAILFLALPFSRTGMASHPDVQSVLPLVPASGSTRDRLNNAIALYIESSQALVNNTRVQIDPADPEVVPVVKNDRTLVPVRFITESLGARVDWDGSTSTAVITAGDPGADGPGTIRLTLGSSKMMVDHVEVPLEVPAESVNGRIFIPLRALAEALGKKVFYDRGLIVISNKEELFNIEADKTVLDELIAKINILPAVGSYEKAKELLAQMGAGADEYKMEIMMDGTTAVRAAAQGVSAAASASGTADGSIGTAQPKVASEAVSSAPVPNAGAENRDYSGTNVQVQGVDEADIVKTDGEYIYQVNGQRVVMIKAYPADDMELAGSISLGEVGSEKGFVPRELYLHNRYLVVIGTAYQNPLRIMEPQEGDTKPKADIRQEETIRREDNLRILPSSYYRQYTTKAIIFDIFDKENPKQVREVELDGRYVSSRKIGSALYLIANKQIRYHIMQENPADLLPVCRDSAVEGGLVNISFSDIRYFPRPTEPNYMIIAGLDLERSNEEVKISTYLGAGRNVYASRQNLYVAASHINTQVYKFSMDHGRITYLCKGEVPGTLLNQFSMDEHEKYFRIATTKGDMWRSGEMTSKNNIYILDEMMKTTGKVEDIAPGERIYSVRFMGDRGYMVTFRTVDPLFVLDLGDPYRPRILGALKIPGYSNYLHPYDENHIMGFGKDTVEVVRKDGMGNQVGSTAYYLGMKMAMFDVSDVNHPVEKFSEKIGDRGTESEIFNNHKALLFDREKNLLAFPVMVMEVKNSETAPGGKNQAEALQEALRYGEFVFQGAYVYQVDPAGGFKLKARISHLSEEDILKAGVRWYGGDRNVERILYIGDVLYTLSRGMIKAHSLADFSEIRAVLLH